MICKGCGTANPDTATFCTRCGRALHATKSSLAGGSLTLGILGLLFSWTPVAPLLALAAIVLGHLAWSQIRRSAGRLAGKDKALAGALMGYLTLPLFFVLLSLPGLLRSRIAANEAYAVGSLRTIHNAQVTYQATYRQGFTCDLSALGGSGTGSAGAAHAQLLPPALASGKKNGYVFALGGCEGPRPEHYRLVAVPLSPGQSGNRAFCSDESGSIRYDPKGSAQDCLARGQPLE